MRQFKFFLVMLILYIAFFMVYLPSSASSPMVEITPSRFELLVEPREKSIQTISIVNHGQEELTLIATCRDWDMDETDSLILLDAVSTQRSASNWLRFNPRQFTIPAGEAQIIRFAVTLPPQIAAGEYRTAIVLETKEEFELSDSFYYQPIFAILVYVNVPEVKRIGRLSEITVKIDDQDNYLLHGRLSSAGNAHVRAEGEFILRDEQGLIVKKEKLGKRVILPGKNLDFQLNLGNDLLKGEYQGEILWRYIPAFYLEDDVNEYQIDQKELRQKVKFTIK